MGRLMQILGVVLAIGLLYAVAAGLGLTRFLKKPKVAAKSMMIEDFEKIPYFMDDPDLGWRERYEAVGTEESP